MVEKERFGSILMADCGTVMTKAVLLEQVAGQYRFIARGEAPTTTEPPRSDAAVGIQRATEQISEATGRRLFDTGGNLLSPASAGRQGVDAFAMTASASEPLQVVVGGLVRDLSAASAERAAAGTYSLVKAILTSDDQTGSLSDEERVRTIRDAAPDVICIAGGIEGGAVTPVLELVETAALACSLMETGVRPRILYAGNSRLRQQVVQVVEKQAEVRATGVVQVHVADNVRPTVTEENLLSAQAELDALYVQEKMGELPGMSAIARWSLVPLTPTARAFGRLVEYLWHLGTRSRGVLGIDVGASSTTLAAAFDGRLYLTIRCDLGTAFGGAQWLQRRGAGTVTRWLPEAVDDEEAEGILINKELRPTTVPQRSRELWLEQAVAREAIRTTLEMARPGWEPGVARPYPHLLPLCDTIIVSGGVLAHAPNPGQVALIVLDALEPIGISTLILDAYGLAPALGSVAAVNPLATVETLDSGALVNLATVITPVGQARQGDVILNIQVAHESVGTLSAEIRYGDLEVLPLPPGQQAVLELHPARHFDVGLGGPGKGGKRRVAGGLAGLIIDARGRPLPLSREVSGRQSQVRRWLQDVGGYG